jgi:hypothetical protein
MAAPSTPSGSTTCSFPLVAAMVAPSSPSSVEMREPGQPQSAVPDSAPPPAYVDSRDIRTLAWGGLISRSPRELVDEILRLRHEISDLQRVRQDFLQYRAREKVVVEREAVASHLYHEWAREAEVLKNQNAAVSAFHADMIRRCTKIAELESNLSEQQKALSNRQRALQEREEWLSQREESLDSGRHRLKRQLREFRLARSDAEGELDDLDISDYSN